MWSDISNAGESKLISRLILPCDWCDWWSDEQEFEMLSWSWNRVKAIPLESIWNYTKVLPNYQLMFIVYHNLSHDNVLWHRRIINSQQLCVRTLKSHTVSKCCEKNPINNFLPTYRWIISSLRQKVDFP